MLNYGILRNISTVAYNLEQAALDKCVRHHFTVLADNGVDDLRVFSYEGIIEYY